MFTALTVLSSIFLMNQTSNKKTDYPPIWPSAEEALTLKKNNPKEFARKMKARQEVYNIGVPWEKL